MKGLFMVILLFVALYLFTALLKVSDKHCANIIDINIQHILKNHIIDFKEVNFNNNPIAGIIFLPIFFVMLIIHLVIFIMMPIQLLACILL